MPRAYGLKARLQFTYILDIELFAGHLARLERAYALPSIVIRELATGEEHAIAFDETAYALACDVVTADGRHSQVELRMLEEVREELKIDRLHAAAIEWGARVRHMGV